jgi:hypothetical protein
MPFFLPLAALLSVALTYETSKNAKRKFDKKRRKNSSA